MQTSMLFLSVYFSAFVLYLFFTFYIVNLGFQSAMNRLFFGVCMSLCFWSFGYVMQFIAPSTASALFWHRFTAVGWSMIYALILHFLLAFTGHERLTSKRTFLAILYGPAILCLFVFSFFNTFFGYEYLLIQSKSGWINEFESIWDLFFIVYYIGYVLTGIVVVVRWRNQADSREKRQQADLIVASFIFALVLGTLTDQILQRQPGNTIPKLAIIEIMFPVFAFYILTRKYGFMAAKKAELGKAILSGQTRNKLYYYLSYIYLFYGLFSLFFNVIFAEAPSTYDIIGSITILVMGFGIFLSRNIVNEPLQNGIVLLLMLLSIPVGATLYLDLFTSSAWAMPLFLIIVSLVFNRSSILFSVTIVSSATQVLIYLATAGSPARISLIDLCARIVFFGIVCFIGYFVNRTYVRRLEDNLYQIDLQKMVSSLSFAFARTASVDLDKNLDILLEQAGKFFRADRSYLFLFDTDNNQVQLHNEWCRTPSEKELGLLPSTPLADYEGFIKLMTKDHFLYFDEISSGHLDTSRLLLNKKAVSLVALPIETQEKNYGFMGFLSRKVAMKLSEADRDTLRTLANLIADKLSMAQVEKEVEYLAYYDQLTGLPNRILFKDRLNQAIHLAKRNLKFVGVVFININSFKAVNSSLGESGGDMILCEVARTLSNNIRKSDTIARFGSDEFLICLQDISDWDQIPIIVDHMMKNFQKPFIVKEQEYFVTLSAGISVYPLDGEDSESLIKNADIAMNTAKTSGLNRFIFCTSEMREDLLKNIMLANHLYRALEHKELSVHYQPQVSLETGKVFGFEALLRWRHPTLGMISPAVFIPLAEKNGLINSIGEWVLHTACQQLKVWHSMGFPHYAVAVNLSAIQLHNPKITDMVRATLESTALPPKFLELEVTESATTIDAKYMSDVIGKLRQLGITISIDDFGTEYSSLKRLKELPVDRIKIDMQFIRGLSENPKDQAITLTIINLAKNLGLRVIAEGVETEQQLNFLKENGCDEVQGYYYYKPMTVEQIDAMLHSKSVQIVID